MSDAGNVIRLPRKPGKAKEWDAFFAYRVTRQKGDTVKGCIKILKVLCRSVADKRPRSRPDGLFAMAS